MRYVPTWLACWNDVSSLPRRGGQPNKKAIARACDFSRDVLYDNAKIMETLNAYANQQDISELAITIKQPAVTI